MIRPGGNFALGGANHHVTNPHLYQRWIDRQRAIAELLDECETLIEYDEQHRHYHSAPEPRFYGGYGERSLKGTA